MLRAYKYRLNPNVKQSVLLCKTLGCVRYFWNRQVETFNTYDKEESVKPIFKTSTEIRKEMDWMLEVSAAAIQQKEIDFKAFKNQYFSKDRKKQIGRPHFKKRSDRQSFRLPNQKFRLSEKYIRLEKIGLVKYVQDRALPTDCKLMSVTVSKESDGKYYASVLVETQIEKLPKTGKTVGIDVGIATFATLNNKNNVPNPAFFSKSQAKLKKAQRNLSRKVKGSSRRNKCKLKVARLHKKIANQRSWFLNTTSTNIVKEYDILSIESLNVSGMAKNHKLAKSISDVSWSKFFSMLEYKANWYGKTLVKIPRFTPSSKMCSRCGNVKESLLLSERTYCCDVCGLAIDRDLNAAININAIGVKIAHTSVESVEDLLSNNQAALVETLRVT